MSILWDLWVFQLFLMGQSFEILMDYSSLHWLYAMKGKSALSHRWQIKQEDYQYTVLHHPGKSQSHMDGLSCLSEIVHLITLDSEESTKFTTFGGLTLNHEGMILLM